MIYKEVTTHIQRDKCLYNRVMEFTCKRPSATCSTLELAVQRNALDKHVRLTQSMLMHKNYIGLSYPAKLLYQYMKLWACGQDTVEYAASLGQNIGIKSKTTFFKARDELINKGFIEYENSQLAKYRRETAIYKFSDKWLRL